MKGRTIAWGEPMEQKMTMTDVEPRWTRFDTALIVFPMAPIPPMPRVRARNHPALLQRCATFYALWTCLHLEAPAGPLRGPPGVQSLGVILLSRNDRHATRQGLGGAMTAQPRGRHPSIKTGTGQQHGEQHAQRLDPQRPRASGAVLAPIIPARGASQLGGLDRVAREARGTRGGLAPCGHAGAFAPGLDQLGPGPVVAPWRTVVIDGALGQHILRQPGPWAPAPVPRKNRVEDFPPVAGTRVPAP
jgi:hypothetical protein